MLTLYTFRPAFGLYDLSPFVTKVAVWLRMAGVEFAAVPGNPRKAPKGKMPYIDHDGKLVADSTLIIEYCSKAFDVTLDEGMTARERALSRAVQSMVEEHLYFTTIYLRWQDDRGWEVVRPVIAELARGIGVPGFMSSVVANQIRKGPKRNAWGQGMGRHDVATVERFACEILDSVSELMSDGPYFFGDSPRTLDATLWPFLHGLRTVPLGNRVVDKVRGDKKLMAYCDRVGEKYAPTR